MIIKIKNEFDMVRAMSDTNEPDLNSVWNEGQTLLENWLISISHVLGDQGELTYNEDRDGAYIYFVEEVHHRPVLYFNIRSGAVRIFDSGKRADGTPFYWNVDSQARWLHEHVFKTDASDFYVTLGGGIEVVEDEREWEARVSDYVFC